MTTTTGILIRPSGSTTERTFDSDEDAAKILHGDESDLIVITGGPSELTGCEGSLLLGRSADSTGREKLDLNPIATALCGAKMYGPVLLLGDEKGDTASVKGAADTAQFIRRALRWICIDGNNDSDTVRDLMRQAVEFLGAWRRDVLTADDLHKSRFAGAKEWDAAHESLAGQVANWQGDTVVRRHIRALLAAMSLTIPRTVGFSVPYSQISRAAGLIGDTHDVADILAGSCGLVRSVFSSFGDEEDKVILFVLSVINILDTKGLVGLCDTVSKAEDICGLAVDQHCDAFGLWVAMLRKSIKEEGGDD